MLGQWSVRGKVATGGSEGVESVFQAQALHCTVFRVCFEGVESRECVSAGSVSSVAHKQLLLHQADW